MIIEPTESDWTFARLVHSKFIQKSGSQHIASEFSLAHLGALLNRIQPRTVLEFGAGIGTITYFLLEHSSIVDFVVTTENEPYCREQFTANIPTTHRNRYELIEDDNRLIPGDPSFDLVIIDGSVSPQGCAHLLAGTVCFVEGGRTGTRGRIQQELKNGGLTCDLTAYNASSRMFQISVKKNRNLGLPYLSVRIPNIRRECWVGAVKKL